MLINISYQLQTVSGLHAQTILFSKKFCAHAVSGSEVRHIITLIQLLLTFIACYF